MGEIQGIKEKKKNVIKKEGRERNLLKILMRKVWWWKQTANAY